MGGFSLILKRRREEGKEDGQGGGREKKDGQERRRRRKMEEGERGWDAGCDDDIGEQYKNNSIPTDWRILCKFDTAQQTVCQSRIHRWLGLKPPRG